MENVAVTHSRRIVAGVHILSILHSLEIVYSIWLRVISVCVGATSRMESDDLSKKSEPPHRFAGAFRPDQPTYPSYLHQIKNKTRRKVSEPPYIRGVRQTSDGVLRPYCIQTRTGVPTTICCFSSHPLFSGTPFPIPTD